MLDFSQRKTLVALSMTPMSLMHKYINILIMHYNRNKQFKVLSIIPAYKYNYTMVLADQNIL